MGSERFAVHIEAQLSGRNLDGRGVVRNLSVSGALIETDALVTWDDQLTLTLTLPNAASPLKIPVAAVRWVRGHHLGVEFMTMEITTFRQLVGYLSGVKKGSDQAHNRQAA